MIKVFEPTDARQQRWLQSCTHKGQKHKVITNGIRTCMFFKKGKGKDECKYHSDLMDLCYLKGEQK
jgi:hypothetical protein